VRAIAPVIVSPLSFKAACIPASREWTTVKTSITLGIDINRTRSNQHDGRLNMGDMSCLVEFLAMRMGCVHCRKASSCLLLIGSSVGTLADQRPQLTMPICTSPSAFIWTTTGCEYPASHRGVSCER
jgi:hypothetical protein